MESDKYSCEGCGETFATGIEKATHTRSCDEYKAWKAAEKDRERRARGEVSVKIRVPGNLKVALDRFIELGTYTDLSDFGRGAFREKLSREAAWILEKIHKDPDN